MNKTYTLNELSLISGLTTRTLRSYLNSGLLKGIKQDGKWQFSETQVAEFVSHPSVKPSIQAKNKAIVFDFLSCEDKDSDEICTIIDLHKTRKEADQACALCIRIINNTEYRNIHFSYEYHNQTGRIILSGPQKFVTDVLTQLEKL